MSIVLSRVDERLVHGRVINDWIARINPTHLIIVDDTLTQDKFMSSIYTALVPLWLNVEIVSLAEAAERIRTADTAENRLFILARAPKAFLTIVQSGIKLDEITFADKAYFRNKLGIPEKDKNAISELGHFQIQLSAINSPSEKRTSIEII